MKNLFLATALALTSTAALGAGTDLNKVAEKICAMVPGNEQTKHISYADCMKNPHLSLDGRAVSDYWFGAVTFLDPTRSNASFKCEFRITDNTVKAFGCTEYISHGE